MMAGSEDTSITLLNGVRDQDPKSWERLVDWYSPLVYGWARRAGLNADDAADVVQEVFRGVAKSIGSFGDGRSEASFRGWLWGVTRNHIRLHFRRLASRPVARGGTAARHHLEAVPDWVERDEEPSTPNERRALIRRILDSVRHDFADQTWQAFWRVAVEGQAAVDVAAQLDMSPSAVRQAKYRVLSRIREEAGTDFDFTDGKSGSDIDGGNGPPPSL